MFKSFFRVLQTVIDRVLFTLSFIVGAQLPEFIQQYSQRLSGHLNEASLQLQQFELIAEQWHQGNLTALITLYQQNPLPAIQETANVIINLQNRIDAYQNALINLEHNNLLQKISYFFTQMDSDIAQATYSQYILTIPLSVDTLITGGVFALVASFSYRLLCKGFAMTINQFRPRATMAKS